jgi:hypothetical protein
MHGHGLTLRIFERIAQVAGEGRAVPFGMRQRSFGDFGDTEPQARELVGNAGGER